MHLLLHSSSLQSKSSSLVSPHCSDNYSVISKIKLNKSISWAKETIIIIHKHPHDVAQVIPYRAIPHLTMLSRYSQQPQWTRLLQKQHSGFHRSDQSLPHRPRLLSLSWQQIVDPELTMSMSRALLLVHSMRMKRWARHRDLPMTRIMGFSTIIPHRIVHIDNKLYEGLT